MGPGMRIALRWTSPRPFGIGTAREVVLPLRAATVRERFFRWDEGKGYSFYVEQMNRPGVRRFAEDYVDRAARHRIAVHLDDRHRTGAAAARVMALTGPVNRVAFGRTAAAAEKYFAQHP